MSSGPTNLDIEGPAAASVKPPLDAGYVPAITEVMEYEQQCHEAGECDTLCVALERENSLVTRADLQLLPEAAGGVAERTFLYAERHVKFLLWARGGWRLYLSGPSWLCQRLQACYSPQGARSFDVGIMRQVYGQPFETCIVSPDEMPAEKEATVAIGGHFDGCRIGFDLGASDYKLAAVVDGEPVYSEEFPWDPASQSSSAYHIEHIQAGLKKAAEAMPRVDAIGGSAAGIYVDNRVKVGSLFRSVSAEDFRENVEPLFNNLQAEWDVPLVVVNDGDVTALAGAISLRTESVLGIAMGSSEAAGYVDAQNNITGYLNELAFAPVDFNPEAAQDEWSQDRGVGVQYFSQQAVNRLAVEGGMTFAETMPLAERLKKVQEEVATDKDATPRRIFETIGVYLGYTLPFYRRYYAFRNVLALGRVTSGEGGEIMLSAARQTMEKMFPGISQEIAVKVPDEKSRRVGQAVAAASLPRIM